MYSGFWRRFAAYILDYIILNISITILFYIWLIIGWTLPKMGLSETMQTIIAFVGVSLLLSIPWLYYALFESSKIGATLGKMALGIKVVDGSGERVSFMRATARFWSKIISTIPLLMGFVCAGFTEKKQAFHDMIASTYVVNNKVKDDFKEYIPPFNY